MDGGYGESEIFHYGGHKQRDIKDVEVIGFGKGSGVFEDVAFLLEKNENSND